MINAGWKDKGRTGTQASASSWLVELWLEFRLELAEDRRLENSAACAQQAEAISLQEASHLDFDELKTSQSIRQLW